MDRTEPAARRRSSLLETLQRLIERTYDLDTGVDEIGRFLIGDAGYRLNYAGDAAAGRIVSRVGAAGAVPVTVGARTLVRESGSELSASVYYPDSLIACLEQHDPTVALHDANVDAFATLVEELDHFLVIAERWRAGGVVSLLDLELHANVTKHLVLTHFVGRMRRRASLPAADRAWVRWHLFGKADFAEPDPELNQRYRTAARMASLYIDSLEEMPAAARPAALRRFHRMTPQQKLASIDGAV